MSLFAKIVDGLGGSIVKEGFKVIKSYFPPSMSDQEKSAAELAFNDFAHRRDMEIADRLNSAEAEFNQRLRDMEGTAGDLRSIPVVGAIIIFLRGCQRPAWGVFVLVADYNVFSKAWPLNDQQSTMLFAINILVLGFLFGERAVKNVMPLIQEFFLARGK